MVASETKHCGGCDITKPVSEFHRRGGGHKSRCKPCRSTEKFDLPSYAAAKQKYVDRYANDSDFREMRKQQERARKYGITAERLQAMIEEQGSRCAICQSGDSGRDGWTWYIDHDHACCDTKGKSCGLCVRSLLCMTCNVGLGAFRDNVDTLLAAVKYLEKHRG